MTNSSKGMVASHSEPPKLKVMVVCGMYLLISILALGYWCSVATRGFWDASLGKQASGLAIILLSATIVSDIAVRTYGYIRGSERSLMSQKAWKMIAVTTLSFGLLSIVSYLLA